jgi:hypothetical protein
MNLSPLHAQSAAGNVGTSKESSGTNAQSATGHLDEETALGGITKILGKRGTPTKILGKKGTPTKILGNGGSPTDPQKGKDEGNLLYSSVEDAGIIGSLFDNPEPTKILGVAEQPTKFLGGGRRETKDLWTL